jgi:hypothetical protein
MFGLLKRIALNLADRDEIAPCPQPVRPCPQPVREPETHRIGRIHAIEDNFPLPKDQYDRCVDLATRLQTIYDRIGTYADRKGIDPTIVLPGNEWARYVPPTGLKFSTRYHDINYLRLRSPFAGYHLVILDRLDEPRFPAPWTNEFLAEVNARGIPENVAQLIRERYDPAERLIPVVPEYARHLPNVPQRYIVRTPRLFGEVGIEVDGVLVNPDVTLCQSRINGMLSAGVLSKLDADIVRRQRVRVLEIGPGYGALAQALRNIYGDALEYICIDLPSSLYHSSIYLSTLVDGDACHLLMPGDQVPAHFKYLFIANSMIEEVADDLGPVELALNTMSFPEMTAVQVRAFVQLFKRVLRPDGIVFDENAALSPHHVDNKAILAEMFPFRKHVSSDIVTTKNWCQDVWSTRYLREIFDRSDAMLADLGANRSSPPAG